MLIPAIPTENQVPILETDVLDVIGQLFSGYGPVTDEIVRELTARLHAGAAKYGTAWNEVDLTEDLREEMLDAMNYVSMLVVRRTLALSAGNADDVLLGMLAENLVLAYKIVRELTPCEGPTSKDWVKERGDATAQDRFQEVLNSFKGEGQS